MPLGSAFGNLNSKMVFGFGDYFYFWTFYAMCVHIYSVYKNMHVLSAWLFVNFELIAYYKFQSLIYSLVHVFVHACVNIGITMQKVRQKSITHLNTISGSTWDTVNVFSFFYFYHKYSCKIGIFFSRMTPLLVLTNHCEVWPQLHNPDWTQ